MSDKRLFMRAYCDTENIRTGEPGEPIRFVISTEGVKRDGKNLKTNQWDFSNYRKNPVVLWAHDYMGRNLPIGAAEVDQAEALTFADLTFDQDDEFARSVEGKYRRGFLHTVSVGWDEVEREGVIKLDLLDISAVPVPGDPDALIERQLRALAPFIAQQDAVELENFVNEKIEAGEWWRYCEAAGARPRALAPHATELEPDLETAFEPEAAMATTSSRSAWERMSAWVDHARDPEKSEAYQLAHHHHSGEVVWGGVADAMIRLFQPTTKIPEEDRRAVYQHLARHYEQFGKTPPEFRTLEALTALEPNDIRGLFLEGEVDEEPLDDELAALMRIKLNLTKGKN